MVCMLMRQSECQRCLSCFNEVFGDLFVWFLYVDEEKLTPMVPKPFQQAYEPPLVCFNVVDFDASIKT